MAVSVGAWVAQRPALLLIGDSLTQEGGTLAGGWAALLAAHYSRRADVVNRGLAGYTTRWGLEVLDRLWAPHGETALTTMWFGANDAADPTVNPRQHVPLDEYKKNLAQLVSRAQARSGAVVVLAPPPIHEAMYQTVFIEPRNGKGAPPDRSLEVSGKYAAAAGEVAAAAGCPFVDLWGRMQAAAPDDAALGRFFYDGLHLSAEGNRFVFDELLATIAERFPGLVVQPDPVTGKKDNSGTSCAGLPPHLPWHDTVTLENQATVFVSSTGGQ